MMTAFHLFAIVCSNADTRRILKNVPLIRTAKMDFVTMSSNVDSYRMGKPVSGTPTVNLTVATIVGLVRTNSSMVIVAS